MFKGTAGSKEDPQKEVEKQVTHHLEDKFRKDYVKDISFENMNVNPSTTKEKCYTVTGKLKFEKITEDFQELLQNEEVGKDGHVNYEFTYFVQYRDGD
ncbi:hypothetical protein [Bacillus mycoides]|uniref:hypothetical protein n=1 Tax=Bacillus cereus group TaxID=86661 RepID=UPI0001A09D48|nr:hypothetical protein [Bacillus mycoides]EEL49684.1 NADH dehydrogenase subunit 2 [Bacillus cereus Rock3-44]